MESLPPSVVDGEDPRFKLKVENRMRNIFVTQIEEARDKDENITYIPVITEPRGRILETGVHTLQRTLVLKKQVELDEVDRELELKQQEIKTRLQALEVRRAELEIKQQTNKEKAEKFEKFVRDNDAKWHRAMGKYQAERKQNELREKEKKEQEQLYQELQARHQHLKNRVNECKTYEDYLFKVLDLLPQNYLDHKTDSQVMSIIQRHETLSITLQGLMERVNFLAEELEQSQLGLDALKQEWGTNRLMMDRNLTELQSQEDTVKEKNKQLEVNLQTNQRQSRYQIEQMGSLLLGIRNLAEQCHLQYYGTLDNMNLLTMMSMIKEFLLQKTEVKKMAIRASNTGQASYTELMKLSGRRDIMAKSKTPPRSSTRTNGEISMPRS